MSQSLITVDEFMQVLAAGMPSTEAMELDIPTLEHGLAVVRFTTGPADVRPGGTIAGPVLFALADLATYAAVMSVIGRLDLAVTTDATIHFLRRPKPGVLNARASVIKNGASLIVCEVQITAEGSSDLLAHVVVTYSKPR